jgi:hypothetical protein
MKKPTLATSSEKAKQEWPPRISAEDWKKALKRREEQLKANALPIPVIFEEKE